MNLLDSDGFDLSKEIRKFEKICSISKKLNEYKGVSRSMYNTLKEIAPEEVYGLNANLFTEEVSGSQYTETTTIVDRLKATYFDSLKEMALNALRINVEKVNSLMIGQSKSIPYDVELCDKGQEFIQSIVDFGSIKRWSVTINNEETIVTCFNNEIDSDETDTKLASFKLPFKINAGITYFDDDSTFNYTSIRKVELLRLCGIAICKIPLASIIACGLTNIEQNEDYDESKFEQAMANCLVEYFSQIQRLKTQFDNYDDLINLLNEITNTFNDGLVFTTIRNYPCGGDSSKLLVALLSYPFLNTFHGILDKVKNVINPTDEITIQNTFDDGLEFAIRVDKFINSLFSMGILNAWMLFIDEYNKLKNAEDITEE